MQVFYATGFKYIFRIGDGTKERKIILFILQMAISHFYPFGVIGINNTSKNLFEKSQQKSSHYNEKGCCCIFVNFTGKKTWLFFK